MIDKDIKNIVKERLYRIPANVSFSIGSFGDFTRDELIKEVENESEAGKAIVDMQLEFIIKMPNLHKNYKKV